MKRVRQIQLSGLLLALTAVAIWLRDPLWMMAPADTLPLALGLPLTYFLGYPWHSAKNSAPRSLHLLAVGGGIALGVGWVIGSLTLLAASWTLLAMIWAHWSFARQARRGRLFWLLLLSFPWLVVDWPVIGWVFRLSSATVAEQVFKLLELPAQRDGTHLVIMSVPVEIEASCAGWNLLQLALLSGVAFGTYEIRSASRFTILLCLIPAIAWLANLLRILILSGIALSYDAQVASGAIHGLTGLVVLGAVLAMTKGLCRLLDPPPAISSRIV